MAANNGGVFCPSSNNSNKSFVQPKLRIKLCRKTQNLAVSPLPTVIEIDPNSTQNSLLSENIVNPSSRSLTSSKSIISYIESVVYSRLGKICWGDKKTNQQTLNYENELVEEILLGHDEFARCVLEIDRLVRIQVVFEECVSRVQLPADVKSVKKDLVATFGNRGMLDRVTDTELDMIANKVLA